jgi:hypothetical protein
MFYHHRKSIDLPNAPCRVGTVRLLESLEDLQAAVERARNFERRGVAVYERRVGNYERCLNDG